MAEERRRIIDPYSTADRPSQNHTISTLQHFLLHDIDPCQRVQECLQYHSRLAQPRYMDHHEWIMSMHFAVEGQQARLSRLQREPHLALDSNEKERCLALMESNLAELVRQKVEAFATYGGILNAKIAVPGLWPPHTLSNDNMRAHLIDLRERLRRLGTDDGGGDNSPKQQRRQTLEIRIMSVVLEIMKRTRFGAIGDDVNNAGLVTLCLEIKRFLYFDRYPDLNTWVAYDAFVTGGSGFNVGTVATIDSPIGSVQQAQQAQIAYQSMVNSPMVEQDQAGQHRQFEPAQDGSLEESQGQMPFHQHKRQKNQHQPDGPINDQSTSAKDGTSIPATPTGAQKPPKQRAGKRQPSSSDK